jgi:hypothetical protein
LTRLSTVIPYPWSNDFAVKVSQSKPGDEILQGSNDFAVKASQSKPGDEILQGSNDFAVKVSQSKPGDEILQRKLHSDEFDHPCGG